MSDILDALFGGRRQTALAFLYLRPEQSVHVREIARATGAHAGSLHRELAKLAASGLLSRIVRGNQVRYRANPDCPVFPELTSLFRKTAGVHTTLRSALEPLAADIHAAFVYGSFARGTEHAHSDIDVCIVGNVGFRNVVAALHDAQTALTREINPCLYGVLEFQTKLSAGDTFLQEVIAQPKLFVLGSDDDLRQLSVHRTATANTD